MRPTSIWAGGVLALSWALSCVTQAADTEVIRMRLDWPVEREARIEAIKTWEIAGPAVQPKPTMRVKYGLRVRRVADTYEADIKDLDLTMDGKNANDQEMIAFLQGLVLFGRADSNGKFLEFFDFDHVLKASQAVWRQGFQGRVSASDMQQILARFTSREVLQSEADRTWSNLVGYWVGSEVRVGASQSTTVTIPLPILRESYQLNGQTTVSDYEKCSPTDADTKCVRIKFSGTPDPSVVKAVISRGAENFGRVVPPNPTCFAADTGFETELLTDPRTLTPYWARWSRTSTMPSNGAPGSETTTSKETTTISFRYL